MSEINNLGEKTALANDYEQSLYSHPSYRFDVINPNTYGTPISLGQSRNQVDFNIPSTVFNWSNSMLSYNVTLNAGAAYIWRHLQALCEVSQIQFSPQASAQWICNLDNVQNYLDVTLKAYLEQDEFLSLDPMVGVSNNNSLVNVIPALRNTNQNTTATDPNLAANPSSVNYREPSYFTVSANATAVTYRVQFPMRLLKDTIFSLDKDFYYGQVTNLRFYFGPITKICYNSTSNNNPSAGTKTIYSGNATITNLQLYLAVETNEVTKTRIINQVLMNPQGMSYMIPFPQAYKTNNSGTSQTITMNLDRGLGKILKKVVHSIYNSQEQLDTAYDRANTGTISGVSDTSATGTTNQKLYYYYTQLNSARIQNINIDCTSYSNNPFLDYMSHKRLISKSILSNSNVYQYNWFHLDDFSDIMSQDDEGNLVSGIPMETQSVTWSFNGLQFREQQNIFNHYTWMIFMKKMTITATGVIVE